MQRITTLGSANAMQGWIAASQRRLADGQEQIATGVRLNRASQSPGESTTLLRNQRSLDRLAQFERNTANARLWLETADTTLNGGVDSLTRARTLAVQGANDTNSVEARAAIAADLRSIGAEMLSLANTTVNNRPIFGGTAGAAQAYDDTGAFIGNTGDILRSVSPNESFSVATNGPAAFGTFDGGNNYAGSVFQVIEELATAVESGDVAQVRAGIEAIDTATSRMQGEVGRLGGLSSRLGEIESRNENSQLSTQTQISQIRDVDMADAIIRLRSAETSYEATLSSASRSLSVSLLDFLR